ncbi:glycoside hydrolase family 55 protein [Acetobacteraceae bacterium KSS8]|uniref:Glycoside hydrolase family 55 protein n=1 Tax=Endosaccharibacter trunci TaxID=2812733 RepID=A0ABT1WAE3_9PROT|nr:glycoside hydrolase family 55 protein [Acetobacteraceae bacterium KSS8]
MAAAIKQSNFAGMNLSAATVAGTPLSTIASQAANAATQSALAGVASTANAALPAAALPSTAIRANFDDVARALADRMSDHLNVKAFGAMGDGVTDDTLAFQNAAAVATGHIPTSIGAGLSNYLSALGSYFLNIGAKRNGAVEIDIPAGHYILTAPIAVNYQTNSAIRWRGDGSSMTELEFRGGVDGLVTTFAQNVTYGNDLARTGNWQGQGIEVEGIHFIANTGIVPAAAAGQTNIGTGQGESGTAIKTIGIQLINASMPPFQIYHDLLFSNSGGWNDAANNWKTALYLQDPDNLFVDHVAFIDHSLSNNHTSIPIWVHSTAPAGGPGHGFLNFDYPLLFGGGSACMQFDGNAIQGIVISHAATVACQDGITWLAAANSLSGSITIADGSLGAQRYMVHITNASTIFSHDNFIYNDSPPVGTDPIYFYVQGAAELISHHDQFYGPPAGTMGSGHSSTAMFVSGLGTAAQPSQIDGDNVWRFDNGLLFGGGSTYTFTNDVVSAQTTTCYRDTSASTTPSLRGQFDGIYCGGTVNAHDGVGVTGMIDWANQRYLNAGVELGLPGITSPGGVAGGVGILDFHSVPSTNGLLSGLNDEDFRFAVSGGTAGTNGSGTLTATGGQFVVNANLDEKLLATFEQNVNVNGTVNTQNLNATGIVTTPSVQYSNFAPPSSASTACVAGVSGDAVVSGTAYHFFCAATNSWVRVSMAAW